MGRRIRRWFRPTGEEAETRALLSQIHLAVAGGGGQSRGQKFTMAPTNGTIALNQLLTPTGVPTAAESRRETYHASFVGEYTLGPGRFSTEASNFYLRGAGRSTVDLNSDMQLRVIRPTDPNSSPAGEITIFTRNLDSNTQLGFDVVADPNSYDSHGRPTQLTIYALDVNVSSGIFVEGIAQGTIDIHYGPGPHSKYYAPPREAIPGVLSQGTATLVINAQVYGIGTTFNLRNVDINP